MKKRQWLLLGLVLAVLFGLIGCSGSKKQKEILKYINDDAQVLGRIEDRLLSSYGSVTGTNYTNDAVTYEEFTENTKWLAKELCDKATEIAGEIMDEEIIAVHRIYMNFSSKMRSVIDLMIRALENQDAVLITEANEMLNEANNLAIDFKIALKKLADKYDIELKQK